MLLLHMAVAVSKVAGMFFPLPGDLDSTGVFYFEQPIYNVFGVNVRTFKGLP